MHKESKMVAKMKIEPMKVDFLFIRMFSGKESTKSYIEKQTVPKNSELKKTYNYNFPLNRITLNVESNQKTIYACWKSEADDVVFFDIWLKFTILLLKQKRYGLGRGNDL